MTLAAQRPEPNFSAAATGSTGGSTFDVLGLLQEGFNSRREGGCLNPIPPTDATPSQTPGTGQRPDSTAPGNDATPGRPPREEQNLLDRPSCHVMRFIENPTPETLPTIAQHFADSINNNFGTTGSYFGTAENQALLNTAMQNIYANLGESGLQQFSQQLQQNLHWNWRSPMPNFSASVSHTPHGSLAHLTATTDLGTAQTQSTMVSGGRQPRDPGLFQGIRPGLLMPEIIRQR